MNLPEPSWRVKTRPCPFFKQGTCLFGDRCNFVHAAASKPDQVAVAQKQSASVPDDVPPTPAPPGIIIESPQSIRSPDRSPRTTNLLLALRDVIGDPDEEEPSSSTSGHTEVEPEAWSESLPTMVNPQGFGHYSEHSDDVEEEEETPPSHHGSNDEEEYDEEFSGNWTAISDYSGDEGAPSGGSHLVVEAEDDADLIEPVEEEDIARIESVVPAETFENAEPKTEPTTSTPVRRNRDSGASQATSASGLLSPIEIPTLHLGPFRHGFSGPFRANTGSFDSGFAESWNPPTALLASPPRSPSICSTFELFSSPFSSQSARILSPRLGVFMPTSPSKTASPGPPQEIEPLDLGLDSPGEYHKAKEVSERLEQLKASWSDRTQSNSEDEEFGNQSSLTEQESDEQDSQFPTHLETRGSSLFLDQDPDSMRNSVSEALKRLSKTPTQSLVSNEVPFSTQALDAHSSLAIHELNEPDLDATPVPHSLATTNFAPEEIAGGEEEAVLAYLRTPPQTLPEQTNNSFNSLYDAYSAIASPKDILSDSMRNTGLSPPQPEDQPLSNVSTPRSSASLFREQVFTPPPFGPGPLGNMATESPFSSSPITSVDSASLGRASPFSPQEDKDSAMGSGNGGEGQEMDPTRRVSFGFKKRLSLKSTNRASLLNSHIAGRTILSSPLEETGETAESDPQSPKTSASISSSSGPPRGLKPLRLSTVLSPNSLSRSFFQSRISSSFPNSSRQSRNNRISMSSSSVSSSNSLSHNRLISSSRSSRIPQHNINRSSISGNGNNAILTSSRSIHDNLPQLPDEPQTAPLTSWRHSLVTPRPSSRISEPCYEHDEDFDKSISRSPPKHVPNDETIKEIDHLYVPHSAPITRSSSAMQLQHPSQSLYAIETPRPTLMFAIASDDINQVRQVLASGDVNPNESVGPQSALAFAIANDKLTNKLEIVKTLLAYGADPSTAKSEPSSGQGAGGDEGREVGDGDVGGKPRTLLEDMDPATRYFVERADAIETKRSSALIQRSFFRPLTRVRYELVGQDRALEQLFRVLSMKSRDLTLAPIVVLMCGPSGHGKSLLARKFGSLLDVPTHTVNMTTLKSSQDLWQAFSMSPYDPPSSESLAEFLINNEGKRCVVVLDEIEKTVDHRILWSLHMPWEFGRCVLDANGRHVDVRNVIWLGTSNIGHEMVFQHQQQRQDPDAAISREEYVELMGLCRPKVSERLGASMLSRVSTVLPFVPFTQDEMNAIAAEALFSLGGDAVRSLSNDVVESMIRSAMSQYLAREGARSLHRAMSDLLLDL